MESWCCTRRLTSIFTVFTPILHICCFSVQFYWPTSPLTLVITTPHEYYLQAIRSTAGELMLLSSYFNQTTPDLGLLKDNSFLIFPQAHAFSWLTGCGQLQGPIKPLSFWLIYYLARSSSLQFYLVCVLLHRALLFALTVFPRLNLFSGQIQKASALFLFNFCLEITLLIRLMKSQVHQFIL